jgi:predicted transcriptional regulator YdeE
MLFRIVELPSLKFASFHVTNSRNPGEEAYQQLMKWAGPKGLFDDPAQCQLFGRNNPVPPDNSELRGYEYLLSIPEGIDTTGVEVVELPGNLYVVVRSKGLEQMQANWQRIVEWIKNSAQYTYGYPENYDHRTMPSLELEHHILPEEGPALIDYYFPITKKG